MNKRKYEFALELHNEMQTNPFSKVSISDICQNMHCSRQSFYYYFNTIEDCLTYYVNESFKNQIKEEYLISDIFNYFDNNADFVKLCAQDSGANTIFWNSLRNYVKKVMDYIYSKNIVEYLTLYTEQKEAIISFHVAGLLEEAKNYIFNNFLPNKIKCISYCKAIFGPTEVTKGIIARMNRS